MEYVFDLDGTMYTDEYNYAEVSLWDLAPLAALVEEAGGRFASLAGVDGPHGGDAVATNGLLHDAVVKRLNG